jgi:hypothetical protein
MRQWARKQIEDAKKRTRRTNRRAARQTANLELPSSVSSLYPKESPAFTARVDISIVSYRVRLADPDGVSRKASLDGLVNCGILADDSAKEIRSIRHRQVKVKNVSEEKTVIKIKRVKDNG